MQCRRLVLAAAFLIGACTGTSSTPIPEQVDDPAAAVPTFSSAWLSAFLDATPAPSATMSATDWDSLLADLRALSSPSEEVAAAFRSAVLFSLVDAADVDSFVQTWCYTNAEAATSSLIDQLPLANSGAMPAFIRLMGLVQQECVGNPELLDMTAERFLAFTASNDVFVASAAPTIGPPPVASFPPAPDWVEGMCQVGGAGAGAVLAERLRGRGGILGAMAVATAIWGCPQVLGSN